MVENRCMEQPMNDSPNDAPRLTMRLVVRQIGERFFDVEKGWLRTVRELTVSPGPMIGRYVAGERTVYANPFGYLLVGTAVSIAMQTVFNFQEKMTATARMGTPSSPTQLDFANQFNDLISQNVLYVTIGVLVPLALLLRLFFRRSGLNVAECLVFALYTLGHLALLGVVLVPLSMLLPASPVLQITVTLAVAVAYTVYAAHGFFPGGVAFTALKAAVAFIIAYGAFMAAMTVAVLAYVIVVLAPTGTSRPWDLVTAVDYDVADVVEQLLDDGADPNSTLGRTALHAAAEHGQLETVDLLIARGADVNRQDAVGRIALHMALAERHLEVARRLAREPTDARVRTTDGLTLLMAAARAEDLDLARWALERGAEINAVRPEKKHATALMIAARLGNAEIVELLLANGADSAATNRDGETAFDLARGASVKDLLRTAESVRPGLPSTPEQSP
jgi:hypothetical protein